MVFPVKGTVQPTVTKRALYCTIYIYI